MDKLELKLKAIRQSKKIGLMTHVVIGYPTLTDTVSLVKTMAAEGVDIVELQIPFSDPLADGPTIMKACERALQDGVKVKDAFIVMQELSTAVTTPLLFMAYYNTVFHYGVEKFCKDAKKAGAAGLIVPDMPLEEEGNEGFYKACKKHGLYAIHVISPASTKDRLQKNAKVADGFIYCTARQGITGAKKSLNSDLASYLRTVRTYFKIPLAVGFGISTPEHLQALRGNADIAIVGSAMIDIINSSEKKDMLTKVRSFIKSLKNGKLSKSSSW